MCGGGAKAPGPTEEERALADISRAQLDRYQEVLAPFEDKWMADSRVTAQEKQLLSGQIGGEVAQAFAGEEKRLSGMDPAGGGFAAGMRELAVARGKAGGKAQAEGVLQAENADVAALTGAVKLGRGQAVEAQAGMGEMASQATSKAISGAFADQAKRDATADMVGSAAGVAAWGAGKGMAPKDDFYKSGGGYYNGMKVNDPNARFYD